MVNEYEFNVLFTKNTYNYEVPNVLQVSIRARKDFIETKRVRDRLD
jgi:hypothetical protein